MIATEYAFIIYFFINLTLPILFYRKHDFTFKEEFERTDGAIVEKRKIHGFWLLSALNHITVIYLLIYYNVI